LWQLPGCDITVCHSSADRDAASVIATRLDRCAESRVWLEECGAARAPIAEAWERGLSSAGIVLLLSPDSVPARLDRAEWEPILKHVTGGAQPPLACVLLRDCSYPRMLERRNFFRGRADSPDLLRELQRWAVSLHVPQDAAPMVPARLPWFAGREAELQRLWEDLADSCGAVALYGGAGSGKTSLAQEFARRAGGQFRGVIWVFGGRRDASVSSELALQLGLPLDLEPTDLLVRIESVLERHRLLVVLDDWQHRLPLPLVFERRSSLLMSTRNEGLGLPRAATIRLERTGGVVAPPQEPAPLRLWQAMSACEPMAADLELAGRVAGLSPPEVFDACRRLVELGLADPWDGAGERFRMNAASRATAALQPGSEPARRRHAECLHGIFSGWNDHPEVCGRYVPEIETALGWALEADWDLAAGLALRAFDFLRSQGRTREGADILMELRRSARMRQQRLVEERCDWELSWVQDESGATRRPFAPGQQMKLF
jgi:hypothetical protein